MDGLTPYKLETGLFSVAMEKTFSEGEARINSDIL